MYCDGRKSIEESLASGKLILSKFNSTLVNMCEVKSFSVADEENQENIGSLHLSITYKERLITRYDKFETRFSTQELLILNTKGDPIWPCTMVTKVWDGLYPSTVAINKTTGVVYLLYMGLDYLKLTEFAQLSENQLEAVIESLNDTAPYRIRLDEDAMFKVIGEVEGSRLLHSTLYIELNCGRTFRVYCERDYGV